MTTVTKATWGATLLAFAASALVYPWLPSTMPTHFDLAGNPNGWSGRAFGAFVLPASMLAIAVFGAAARKARASATTAILVVFLLALHVLVLRAALGDGTLGGTMWLVTGVAFVALGLVLPRVRMNRWVGVRTPWSMSSPEAWARSQRAGGRAMLAGGLVLALSSAWNGPGAMALHAVAFLGMIVVSVVSSWAAAKAHS